MNAKSEIMIRAGMTRSELGLDDASPVDVFLLIQGIENLTVVCFPMGDRISGMCLKHSAPNAANVIAVNSDTTLGRQRFSIAHELYHLFYDENMRSVSSKKIGYIDGVEKEADCFASFFLMPPAALRTKINRLYAAKSSKNLSLRNIISLEQYFGMSHQATIIRLRDDGFISVDEAKSLINKSVKSIAAVMGYNTDLYCASSEEKRYRTYGNYIKQADEALKRRLISNGKYEELLLTAFRADLVYGDDEEGGEIID